jgi:hypothetical protein
MPVKKEIIYPFFLECCQHADDSFWENIFEELAYGKAPYGAYISKDFLCCSYKNKEFSYKIERKDPEELYSDIYKLLTEKLGLLSYREKQQKKLDFHQVEKDILESRNDWANIRRKNIKDIMYEQYVIDMKKEYNLDNKEAKRLLAVILVSMMFKTITTKDIEYNDGKIQNIDGINFEQGKVILERPICSNIIDSVTEELETSKRMYDNWDKYLKSLRAIYA